MNLTQTLVHKTKKNKLIKYYTGDDTSYVAYWKPTATIYQKPTHVFHAASNTVRSFTLYKCTVYSLILTFEDYWLSWSTKQNKNQ